MKSASALRRTLPLAVANTTRERIVGALVLGQRQHRGDRLALGQLREQVDHRLAARLRVALRQAVDLELVDPARPS